MRRKKTIETMETDNKKDSPEEYISDDAEFKNGETGNGGAAPEEAEFTTEPLVSSKKKSGAGFISWLALILSCAALAAFAYTYMTAQSGDEVSTLVTSLESTRNSLAALEQQVEASGSTDNARESRLQAELDALNRAFDDRLRQMEALPGRLSSVEASLASVQGISAGARTAWLLAEAEYYMQIANAQMQLARNPTLAGTALAYADERIIQIGDPRLTGIRQALSDEQRALEAMQKPDTAGITLTLASLSNAVATLPLLQEAFVIEESTSDTAIDLSGWDRALASMKNALGKAVTVRRTDEAMQPLIAPEALYFLRTNLALQLQIARLALLRNEEDIFRQSLDDADTWLAEYYDPDDSGVQSTRATLREIRDSTVAVAAPDISRSLRLLQQFNAINSAANNNGAATPEVADEPPVSEPAIDASSVEETIVDGTTVEEAIVAEPESEEAIADEATVDESGQNQ